MGDKNYTGLIPEQKEGRKITAEAATEFQNAENANTFFQQARKKLLYIHNWHKIAGWLSADFQLTDNDGNEVDRLVKKDDHFRIDIAGPGSHAGEGFDWARVEDVKEVNTPEVDSIAILVRPASNPQTPNANVAHFLSEKSTSTFVITREGNKVTASIYDRNIEANEETKEPLDKFRNAVIGLGAKHGFSKLQWQALAEALVKKE
ncbi:MAG TPA: hypothetical protein VNT20_10155 [Flavisolibacter sp.]|jgi:hypothetical protein|nr:hypothetical protein [Flavisolibacter sp.]